MSKRATTTMSQGTKRNVDIAIESAISASKKRTSKRDGTEDVLEIVLGNGFLHWSDMMMLSGVNKACYRLVKSSLVLKVALEELLVKLDPIVITNTHFGFCNLVYAPRSKCQCDCKETKYDEENHPSNSPFANVDPRFLDEYDHWPVEKKVSKMVAFLTMLATNFRAHFDFDDLSRNFLDGKGSSIAAWIFDFFAYFPDDKQEYVRANPRRTTMMANLAVLFHANSAGDYCFGQAFLGKGPIVLGDAGMMHQMAVDTIDESMGCFGDDELVKFVRDTVYPTRKYLALLGLPLIKKVYIAAPLFSSIPMFAGNDQRDLRLPDTLEPVVAWE
jgi:hypothetical protein